MCHRILRVSYHSDKAKDLIEVENADDLDPRLKEIMSRPGVRKVTIFNPTITHEEVKRWETTEHNEEEK